MSKELTPLQAWERANNNAYEHGYEISGDLCYIIETALKDYEHSQKQRELYFKQAKELKSIELGNQNKLKAFEIIKEKKVNVQALFYSSSCEDYNKHYTHYEDLTQEEYELLKEIFGNE